ncbi:hypothetical protein ACFL4W_02745 [Planctomycetota bacterium]
MRELEGFATADFPKGLIVLDFLDFQDYPILTIEKDTKGRTYLSYLVKCLPNDFEQRALIQVSAKRLNLIRNADLKLINIYENAEFGEGFILVLSERDHSVTEAYKLPIEALLALGVIEDDYILYSLESEADSNALSTFDTVTLAQAKDKILLDLYVHGDELLESIRTWVIYNVFCPFVEIVKEMLDVDSRRFDRIASFGNLRQASFGISIELNHEDSLFNEKIEFDKLKHLVKLMEAQSKSDIDRLIPSFKTDLFLKEYTKIVRTVSSHDIVVNTSLAEPTDGQTDSGYMDRERAEAIKKVLDEDFQEIVDIEDVRGRLLDIKLSIKYPSFVLADEDEDLIKGKITPELVNKITEDKLNLGKMMYDFKIRTVYQPETSLKKEKISKTLIEYKPIDKDQGDEDSLFKE